MPRTPATDFATLNNRLTHLLRDPFLQMDFGPGYLPWTVSLLSEWVRALNRRGGSDAPATVQPGGRKVAGLFGRVLQPCQKAADESRTFWTTVPSKTVLRMNTAEWNVATNVRLGDVFSVRPGQQCELRNVKDDTPCGCLLDLNSLVSVCFTDVTVQGPASEKHLNKVSIRCTVCKKASSIVLMLSLLLHRHAVLHLVF